jgi:hypothetical protein
MDIQYLLKVPRILFTTGWWFGDKERWYGMYFKIIIWDFEFLHCKNCNWNDKYAKYCNLVITKVHMYQNINMYNYYVWVKNKQNFKKTPCASVKDFNDRWLFMMFPDLFQTSAPIHYCLCLTHVNVNVIKGQKISNHYF